MKLQILLKKIVGVFSSWRNLTYGLLAMVLLAAALFLLPRRVSSQASQPLRIGIAEWRQEGGPARDLQSRVHRTLRERLKPLGLAGVSVTEIPEPVPNAEAIDTLASKYDVDVIVWGWYDQEMVWSYVDLARATDSSGRANSLAAFLQQGGSPDAVRVMQVLSAFDYDQDGAYFCVPRWSP